LPSGLQAQDYNLAFYMTQDSAQSNNVSFTGDDSIHVRISEDSGATWQRIAGFNRNDPGLNGFTWIRQSVPLDAYAGKTIQIGFEAVSFLGNVIGLDSITVSANTPLPVKLLNFEGRREGNKNSLQWKTSNELNNKGFEIQRGFNGAQYTTIGFINSKATNGNSAATLSYNFVDEKPLTTNNYYRLRQVDLNGKENFSNVVVLRPSTTVKAEITKLYPNPVSERLNVVLNTVSSEKVTLNLTDLTGRIIEIRNIETTVGDNNINFNTSRLAKGTYMIKVTTLSNIEIATQKFVKM
jgi:hypothetical protein